jgi:hypothetical protein
LDHQQGYVIVLVYLFVVNEHGQMLALEKEKQKL